MDNFLNRLVTGTEAYLTWRARRRRDRRIKQAQKNVILDWVEAFLWAAGVVLLVNQYLFQAYEIPSESMEPTLHGNELVHDRIFVNKFLFGPELLPGLGKLPGFTTPQRGDIVIFENPSYLSQGPVFDVAQRLLYMLTLSLVDIDRDPVTGKAKPHFLIKRAIGYSGDVVRWRRNEPQFQLPGTDRWLTEAEMQVAQGLSYAPVRSADEATIQAYYQALPGALRAQAASSLGQTPAAADLADQKLFASLNFPLGAGLETERQNLRIDLAFNPTDAARSAQYFRLEYGTWVPEGSLMPLGDNRDNSNDGRYFGSIPLDKILGKAAFRYWPSRFGAL